MDVLGWELLKGIGRFFTHPLTYVLPIAMFLTGYFRVKRERIAFNTRVFKAIFDLTVPIIPGLIAGGALSVLTVLLGVTVPFSFLLLMGAIMAFFLLIGRIRWLSPSFTVGLAIVLALYLPMIENSIPWMNNIINDLEQRDYRPALVLLSLFLMAEGLLVWRNGQKQTSPIVEMSKRGKWIGGHRLQRVWLLPTVLFVPGGALELWSWWPVLQIGDHGLSLFIVPIAVGAKYSIFHTLPRQELTFSGIRIIWVGIVAAIGTVVSYIYPEAVVYTAVLAILGRAGLMMRSKWKERTKTPLFRPRERGIRVLGILPGSPAEKMGIVPGDVVMKINGQVVNNPSQFYQAIQVNSAYCKVEVADMHGEIRHTQAAVYDNEHHELGVLFLKEREYLPLQSSGG